MTGPIRPELDRLALDFQRALLHDARRELTRSRLALRAAERALESATRDRSANSQPRIEEARATVAAAREAATGAADRARLERDSLGNDLLVVRAPSPEEEIARLGADRPIVFLPIRIETRFRGRQLLLRVYPDEILAESHEPELTDSEVLDGETFWEAAWPGEEEEKSAWRELVRKVEAPRAAWIAQAMIPSNLTARPGTPPVFPNPARREKSWTRASEAHLLPDRWHVLLRSGGNTRLVSGGPIVEPLALTFSPDPAEASSPLSDDGLSLNDAVRWTVDFAAAVKVGMALSIALEDGERAAGFDRIVVFGVKSTISPEQGAVNLAGLLEQHRFDRGAAFVAQGTATNNTSAGPTAFPLPDPDARASFAVERRAVAPVAGRDGGRLTAALGLPVQAAEHVSGADGREQERAAAMARVLWPVTLGYFLEQLMEPVFGKNGIEEARRFFLDYVRGRGPLSAFRIGSTPYGILPVSSLARWQAQRDAHGVDAELPAALRALQRIWSGQLGKVPRIGRSADADGDLLETLGLDASSREVRVRPVTGEDATWNLFGFSGWGIEWSAWLDAGQQLANQVFTRIGHPDWRPRIGRFNFGPEAFPFRYHLVTEADTSETQGLVENYIEWIRTASVPDLVSEQVPAGWTAPVSLLYRLLRHGALHEYLDASHQLAVRARLAAAVDARETEFQGLPSHGARATRIERLMQPVPNVSGQAPIHAYLTASANAATLRAILPNERVVGFRDALAALAPVPTAELERLFTETLDTVSHRLDAWITGLATKRLETMRAQRPLGCHLGAYGWVEQLRPKSVRHDQEVKLADGTVAVRQSQNGGYVQAPSMTHAAAAAVLRNAYLSRTGDERSKYAVDLSSARVRLGRFILDAVREGQPLGAVLGYQVERGLHDQHQDILIAPLRAVYPLVAGKSQNPDDFTDPNTLDTPRDHIAARNVVDGLALRRAFSDGQIPWGQRGLPAAGAARQVLEAELRRLDEAVDAVADLVLSESVYQIVKGSPATAAASLDAMAQGSVRPPDPEIATQPRRGTALTHRVAIVLGGAGAALPAGWANAATPRAALEPRVDAWLGQLFGDANAIVCQVDFGPVAGPADLEDISAADLAIRPIDLCVLATAQGRRQPSGSVAESSELDRRLLEAAHAKRGLVAEQSARINYGRPAGFDPVAQRALADVLQLAHAVEQVIAKSRPLTPEDLLAADRADDARAADRRQQDAIARATAARTELNQRTQALAVPLAAVAGAPENALPDLTALRNGLRSLALAGVPGAWPLSALGNSLAQRRALVAQASSVQAEAGKRLQRAQELLDNAAAPAEHLNDVGLQLRTAKDVVELVVGTSCPFVPAFKPAAATELDNALNHGATATFIPGTAQERGRAVWKFEVVAARVRPALDAWRRLELYTSALGGTTVPRALAQLPDDPAAAWAALPFADESGRPKPGRISVLLYQVRAPATTADWAGFALDSWSEYIPEPSEQTGIAFHYDDPGAEAPQTVLLAVPPVPDAKRWELDWVIATLHETLDLAKLRAVDGELLGELGPLLPAIYLADATDEVTVRSSFIGTLRREAMLTVARP